MEQAAVLDTENDVLADSEALAQAIGDFRQSGRGQSELKEARRTTSVQNLGSGVESDGLARARKRRAEGCGEQGAFFEVFEAGDGRRNHFARRDGRVVEVSGQVEIATNGRRGRFGRGRRKRRPGFGQNPRFGLAIDLEGVTPVLGRGLELSAHGERALRAEIARGGESARRGHGAADLVGAKRELKRNRGAFAGRRDRRGHDLQRAGEVGAVFEGRQRRALTVSKHEVGDLRSGGTGRNRRGRRGRRFGRWRGENRGQTPRAARTTGQQQGKGCGGAQGAEQKGSLQNNLAEIKVKGPQPRFEGLSRRRILTIMDQ